MIDLNIIDLPHLAYSQKSIIGSGGYMPEDVQDVMTIKTTGRSLFPASVRQFFCQLLCALQKADQPVKALRSMFSFASRTLCSSLPPAAGGHVTLRPVAASK